jgi:hypothetical protein
MTDLVKRLRTIRNICGVSAGDEEPDYWPNALEAADRIEQLEAELHSYATDYCEGWCKDSPPNAMFDDCGGCRARAALDPSSPPKATYPDKYGLLKTSHSGEK